MSNTFNGIRPGDKVTFSYPGGLTSTGREYHMKTAKCIMAFPTHVVVQHTGNGYCVNSENYSEHKTTKAKKLPPCSVPTHPFIFR